MRPRGLAQSVVALVVVISLLAGPGVAQERPAGAEVSSTPRAESVESLNAQAEQLYKERKYTEAVPLVLRALALREKSLGPEHPDVALSLNHLALS